MEHYRMQSSDETLKAWLLIADGDISKYQHGVSEPLQAAYKAAQQRRANIIEELALREQEHTASRHR